jgi:hypothetical protein
MWLFSSCILALIHRRGFNLPNFVDTAFKDLRSDVELQAAVTIGQYQTTLNYTQLSVPIITDSSLNNILPVLARPIVQKIVDGTVIGYTSCWIYIYFLTHLILSQYRYSGHLQPGAESVR